MAIRQRWVLLFVAGIFAFAAGSPVRGGEDAKAEWDKSAARQYLDSRGAEWFKFDSAFRGKGASATSCVSCHSLLAFALARPVLRRMTDEKAAH